MIILCGRFLIESNIEDILSHYGLKQISDDSFVKGEIYPGTKIPVILKNRTKTIDYIHWGFQVRGMNREVINSRIETVSEKPAFRRAFLNNRCIIPANAFFEWNTKENSKVKYKIKVENERLFSMAGIYDLFIDKNNKEYLGVVILTAPANQEMSKVHYRMPVIIENGKEDKWLEASEREILEIREKLETDSLIKLNILPAEGMQQLSFNI